MDHLSVFHYYQDTSCETYHHGAYQDVLHTCYQLIAEPVDGKAFLEDDGYDEAHQQEYACQLLKVPAISENAVHYYNDSQQYYQQYQLTGGVEFRQT